MPAAGGAEEMPAVGRGRRLASGALLLALACGAGVLHYCHVSTLFENERNFSHLSKLEREMSLRTEMGFYYSYFKTVAEERQLLGGIAKLAYDRLVEYPAEVNAINRFNIYPEMLIGALYRYCEPWLNTSAHRTCHMVHRGSGLEPVESCVGLGEPIMLYLEVIWWLAGITVSVVFLLAACLCGNMWGGLLAAAGYFANHAECTRVQWAPNERENFTQPFLLAQMALVTLQLRRPAQANGAIKIQVSILVLNCVCLLFWQFSQFIFLTQIAVFFAMEQLRVIDNVRLCIFLHTHFCGLHMAILLMQGNDMLKTSIYASFFLVVSIYCLFLSSLRIRVVETGTDLLMESLLVLMRIGIVVTGSLWARNAISDFLDVEEDSHIFDILLSKFTSYKTFHTMLYTCSAVFSFMPASFFWELTKTGLLPLAGFAVANVLYCWISSGLRDPRDSGTPVKNMKAELKAAKDESADDSGIENSVREKPRRRQRKSSTKSQKSDSDGADGQSKIGDSKHESNAENDQNSNDVDSLNNDCKHRRNYHKWVLFLRQMDIDPGVFYNVSQMAVFGIMAVIIMRLKLLFTPHLCVVSALVTNTAYYNRGVRRSRRLWVCAGVALACAAGYHGYRHIAHERLHYGEYSNVPLEQLLAWVSEATGRDAVFAGPAPLAAAVLLSTRSAVVNHPHYEHKEVRQRTYSVYKTYGRFSPLELHAEMTRLRVTYLLLERQYCYGQSELGCSFEEIWDHEAPALRGRPRLCHRLLTEDVPHFYQVFANSHYAVFRVHDYSVRYTPRLYAT